MPVIAFVERVDGFAFSLMREPKLPKLHIPECDQQCVIKKCDRGCDRPNLPGL